MLRTIQFPGQSEVGAIVAREGSSCGARRSPRNATFGQSDRMSKYTRGAVFPTPWGEIGPGYLGDGRWKTRRSPDLVEQTPRRWERPLQEEQTERGVAQIRVRATKVPCFAGRGLPGARAGSHDAATPDVCATSTEFLAQPQSMQAQDECEWLNELL